MEGTPETTTPGKSKHCDCDLAYSEETLPSYPGDYDVIPNGIAGTLKFTRMTSEVEVMCIKHHPFFKELFSGYKDELKASSCIAHAWTHIPTSTLKFLWSDKIEGDKGKELSRYYCDLVDNVEGEWKHFIHNRRARAHGYYCFDNNVFSNEDLDMIERDYPNGESAHIRHAYARGISIYKAWKRWRRYHCDSDTSTSDGESSS